MKARYLLRVDDACHGMDRHRWGAIEALFDRLNIKPLVAVVPDNLDSDLDIDDPDPQFWQKVRCWQEKGWTIAMHGYQHILRKTDAKMILPFYGHSEFAGLNFEEQSKKIRNSWKVFLENGIHPTVWIAPAHCFDWTTVAALKAETSIRMISDGIARDIYVEQEFHWLPQQLWNLQEKSSGLWTVCLHPNSMTEEDISGLGRKIEESYSSRIVGLDDVTLYDRKKDFGDRMESFMFWSRHRKNQIIRKLTGLLRG